MDPVKIIEKYYTPGTKLYKRLMEHNAFVLKKALAIVDANPHLKVDKKFITEAIMLHDIGIYLTSLPKIDCHGQRPYIQHGLAGAEILEKEGLPKHARIALTHASICIEDIDRLKLDLPRKNYVPETVEEKIIYVADKFHSKNNVTRNLDKVKKLLAGDGRLEVFEKVIKSLSLNLP